MSRGYDRNPEKLTRQLERDLSRMDISWETRQSGSHRTYKTDRGNVVIPMHGELPEGTFMSIVRMIVRLGIVVQIFLVLVYIFR